MKEYDKGYEIMQTTLILQDCGYAYENAEDIYLYIQDVIKRHNEKDSGEGAWLESLRNFIESDLKWLRCEKCGISSEEVSLISEADICYQCEKEESEVK